MPPNCEEASDRTFFTQRCTLEYASSAIMTTKAGATVILKGSDDWFDWIDQVANYARQLHLWQFVDPDAANRPPILTEPREPVAPTPTQAPAPEPQPGEAAQPKQAPPEPIPVPKEL